MSTPDHPDDPRGPGEPRRSEPVNGPAAGPLPQRGAQDRVAPESVTERVRQPLQPRPLPRPIPSNPQQQPPTQAMPAVDQQRTTTPPPVSSGPNPQGPNPQGQQPKLPTRQPLVPQPNNQQPNAGQPVSRPADTTQVRPANFEPPQHQGPPTRGGRPVPEQRQDGKNVDPSAVTAKVQNGHNHSSTPPWQRAPQREPQSNLNRPGEAPVVGKPPVGAPQVGREQVEEAKSQRKEAAKAKSDAIDGPTRSIARPELAKDMPDLSEVRHPLPQEASAPALQPAGAAVAVGDGTPLRATVQLRRIDPWSTLKVTLVISVALFFIWMVAVGLLYIVLAGMGVWDRLNNAFTDIVSDSSSDGLVSAGQIFGYAAGIGLINVVLFTALATIGSFIYNQCSDLVGGIEVTLADPD